MILSFVCWSEFENVENEWPVFYVFMIIDGIFKDNQNQVNEYQVGNRLIFVFFSCYEWELGGWKIFLDHQR
jgi:hypothetical protein